MHRTRVIQRLQAQELETAQLHEKEPTFDYSYKYDTDQLHRTKLATGEQSSHRVPSCQFKDGCCWSEVPGGGLIVTGGGVPAVGMVVIIGIIESIE
jgi:hypothetical protein